MKYVDVILPVPLEGTFTYTVSDEIAVACATGVRVLVPFGKSKTYAGVVVRVHDNGAPVAESKLKEVLSVLDASPVLLPHQLRLWQWIASYYMSPIGEVLNAALPAGLKADTAYRIKTETYLKLAPSYRSEQALHVALNMLSRSPKRHETFLCYLHLAGFDEASPSADASWQPKEVTREELMNEARCTSAIIKRLTEQGFLEVYEKEVGRLNHAGQPHPENIHPLSRPQQQAYDAILKQWQTRPVVLLHGVTSSGKTEIYIHLIQKAIDEGLQVLYLLPEIALTVQMTQRLRRVFGDRLGIYHSKYSDAERVEIWRRQLSLVPRMKSEIIPRYPHQSSPLTRSSLQPSNPNERIVILPKSVPSIEIDPLSPRNVKWSPSPSRARQLALSVHRTLSRHAAARHSHRSSVRRCSREHPLVSASTMYSKWYPLSPSTPCGLELAFTRQSASAPQPAHGAQSTVESSPPRRFPTTPSRIALIVKAKSGRYK